MRGVPENSPLILHILFNIISIIGQRESEIRGVNDSSGVVRIPVSELTASVLCGR
jgi:hypothetical protein